MVHYIASRIIDCVVVVRQKLEWTKRAVGRIGRCFFRVEGGSGTQKCLNHCGTESVGGDWICTYYYPKKTKAQF